MSLIDNDRQEAADARRDAPVWREPRRIGSALVEEPDYPDWDEAS